MSAADRLTSHYASLDRAIGFTKAADAKAGPLIGLQVALAGTLSTRWDKLQSVLLETPWFLERAMLLLVAGGYVILLVSAILLGLRVYMPINPRTGRSLIYFEDIAARDFTSFQAQARAVQPAVIEHQLLDQIHRVSAIASVKMRWVRWTFWLSLASTALWLVLLAAASVA